MGKAVKVYSYEECEKSHKKQHIKSWSKQNFHKNITSNCKQCSVSTWRDCIKYRKHYVIPLMPNGLNLKSG